MTKELIIEAISKKKKGTFINLKYFSKKKPLAAHKEDNIIKHSNGTYRLGIGYYNINGNQDKERKPSTKGNFEEGLENYIIKRIDKNGNEVNYLRVYTTNHKTTSQWTLNGQEVTKEWLIDNGYISKSKSQPIDCFDINIDNIISIGK